ncbi:MAG: NUDIX domain-containing protein, partial [Rhodobacteraceae bacterium]|nr:NUDIX domain-containing protein [Paracoccaceae bacterium]
PVQPPDRPGHALGAPAPRAGGAGVRPAPGSHVAGYLVHPDATALARLERYVGLRPARDLALAVTTPAGEMSARAYVPSGDGAGPWALADWQVRHAAVERLAWDEMQALARAHPPDALKARYPMALAHAASRLRAESEPQQARLRGAWGRGDIRPLRETRPYAWFFAVSEDDLQFRQFDGVWSAKVKRAAFVMSDAVTVLPYDPARDAVMLVEQFRYGPWIRGAQNAWSLEPIAGRVDPGETPPEAALREAQEEARLTLAPEALLPIGNCYPSPGAVTEFLYQYVVLCDLPEGAEGISGLDSEAEDIRSHILPFDRLMRLVAAGEVQNGPLLLSAYWLAANRDRLRQDA